MRKRSLKLPNWMIKSIEYGREDEELSFFVVNAVAFYLLGLVCFFVFNPLGKGFLAIKIICTAGIAILLALICLWIIAQVTLLTVLRKEAVISYKNSKTDKNRDNARLKLNELNVPISVISQDYGSIWADSVIRTPIGIYGVDTTAKKIWRFSDSNGFETLSDMKIQRFLNDNINLGLTRQENLGITNVKTHFNNYKGDVMFTFYHTSYDETNQPVKKEWNMCYNERQGLWVTRYDWIPIFSANVDNVFYSIPLELYSDNNDFSIWKHGRTGIDSFGFRPTLWYGKQHSFEFEFAIKDPVGLHKIFENLVITSNNVQPKELEFQIIGDAYMFNKARIYHDAKNIYGNYGEDRPYKMDWNGFTKDDFSISNFKPMFYNARVEYDPVLDEYSMIISQQCKNKETYGVRLGNIQYKEDGWYTNIEPLRYNVKLNQQSATEFSESDPFASAKIRDKWLKVRIKYAGDKLAIISGVTTFENMSYA